MKLTALQKLIVVLLLLLTSSFVAAAQERSITLRGRVVDANTGEPMANVRVVAKLTDKSTITDSNGLCVGSLNTSQENDDEQTQ